MSSVAQDTKFKPANEPRPARHPGFMVEFGVDEDPFRLPEEFLSKYEGKQPNFGYNGLGEFVFYRTYSRLKPDGSKESFADVLKRVVEGTYEIQRRHCRKLHISWDLHKAQVSAMEMFERMWQFKFLPPGRGLWMMGTEFMWQRGGACLNNCFAAETEIITRDGIKRIGDVSGTTQTILSANGQWIEAPIRSFGVQPLMKLTIVKDGSRREIFATPNHRWFAKNETRKLVMATVGGEQLLVKPRGPFIELTTAELQPGLALRSVYGDIGNIRPSQFGISHGFCFGDGTLGHKDCSTGSYLYLCGVKDKQMLKYFSESPISFDKSKGKDGAIRVADIPRFFKAVPNYRESKTYLYGFLAGYFAADGSISKKGAAHISSSKLSNLLMVRDICAILGIGTNPIRKENKYVKHKGKRRKFIGYKIYLRVDHLSEAFFLLRQHQHRYLSWRARKKQQNPNWEKARVRHRNCGWIVESVEMSDRTEEVFCATVPRKACFALADNILTGNCGFCSTEDITVDPAEPFCFTMDMAMLGVGIGFDTVGAGKVMINMPTPGAGMVYEVPDSREGWVDSVRQLIYSYTRKPELGYIEFDYSNIRPAGLPIKGFGGYASGPGVLQKLHLILRGYLARCIGKPLSSVGITDIMNMIGACVVAGNVRRTALICIGANDDPDYFNMKNPTLGFTEEETTTFHAITGIIWDKALALDIRAVVTTTVEEFQQLFAERCTPLVEIPLKKLEGAISTWNDMNTHRWASNNSVSAFVGMDYTKHAEATATNGEPGYVWLDNLKDYGRMIDGKVPGIDGRVRGVNPCFSGDMRLFTADGYKTMLQLWAEGGNQEFSGHSKNCLGGKYGSMQIVNKNGLVAATRVFKTGENVDLFRVTFSNGSWIDATANHEFILVGANNGEYRKALSDLMIGERVPVCRYSHFADKQDSQAYIDYAGLAGWCIGDGSLSPKADGQTRAQCNCYESDIEHALPSLRTMLTSIYAEYNTSSNQNPAYDPWDRPHGEDGFEHREAIVGSNVLGRLLAEDGVVSGNKHRVPTSLWQSSKAAIANFIKCLASADGFVNIGERSRAISVRISQANREFLLDVRLLLTQFGISSVVVKRRDETTQLMRDGKGGMKEYRRKDQWELIVSGINHVRKYIDQIGFVQPWKTQLATIWLANHRGSNNTESAGTYTKIESIEYLGKGDTFCLTEPISNAVIVEGQHVAQCAEQSLEPYELCTLVETFPSNHTDAADFLRTLKFAYLYAKTVTLLPTHNPRTNSVMLRNRRIGLSQTGLVRAYKKFGRRAVLRDFCDAGYHEIRRWDAVYSGWLCIGLSNKVSSIKPSGTISLVVGVPPGLHYPEAPAYWRHVRAPWASPLVKIMINAGYHVEPDLKDSQTAVIRFGVDESDLESVNDVSLWRQVVDVVDLQRYWADNQPSCTVKFKPHERGEIKPILEAFEDQLKCMSFLPHRNHGFVQAPYVPASPDEVREYNARLKPINFMAWIKGDAVGTKYCDGETCEMTSAN